MANHIHIIIGEVSNQVRINLFQQGFHGQTGPNFADKIFNRIFTNEKVRILIKISLKFVPTGPIDNNPALL